MQKLKFQTSLKIAMLASVAQIVAPAHAQQPLTNGQPQQMQLATGQFITPTAARGSVQQMLNPGLAKYPDFIAGEGVRSQLSPDGKTLAVLTAGFNSLDDASGQTDIANSTQYIFIYDVSGANKYQACAHAGDQADELPCRPRLLARWQDALRDRRRR
jgi:hypothetical protein